MIEFRCAKCGLPYQFPNQLAGRKANCPGCGNVNVVPAAFPRSADPTPEPGGDDAIAPIDATTDTVDGADDLAAALAEAGPGGVAETPADSADANHARKLRKKKKDNGPLWAGLVVLGVIVVSVVLYFSMRDTWERDNLANLQDMSRQAEDASASGDFDLAKKKYDAIFSLVKDREISSEPMKALLADAQEKQAVVASVVSLKDQIAQLTGRAATLVTAGRYDDAIKDYNQVLDLLAAKDVPSSVASQANDVRGLLKSAQAKLAEAAPQASGASVPVSGQLGASATNPAPNPTAAAAENVKVDQEVEKAMDAFKQAAAQFPDEAIKNPVVTRDADNSWIKKRYFVWNVQFEADGSGTPADPYIVRLTFDESESWTASHAQKEDAEADSNFVHDAGDQTSKQQTTYAYKDGHWLPIGRKIKDAGEWVDAKSDKYKTNLNGQSGYTNQNLWQIEDSFFVK